MSNRRRLRNPLSRKRDNSLRAKKNELPTLPTPGSRNNGVIEGDINTIFAGIGGAASYAPVVKVVVAKVDGVRVGDAYIHDDGLVSIRFDDQAPPESMVKIKETAESLGYSVTTEDTDGTP